MSDYIKEFASVLIENVRDAAIRSCDRNLNSGASYDEAKNWKKHATPEVVEFVKFAIPDCVDAVLGRLLSEIDQGVLKLFYQASDGSLIDLEREGEGEMSGWYGATGGLREIYSRERFMDYFADLR